MLGLSLKLLDLVPVPRVQSRDLRPGVEFRSRLPDGLLAAFPKDLFVGSLRADQQQALDGHREDLDDEEQRGDDPVRPRQGRVGTACARSLAVSSSAGSRRLSCRRAWLPRLSEKPERANSASSAGQLSMS
jgi:hypothetical protein